MQTIKERMQEALLDDRLSETQKESFVKELKTNLYRIYPQIYWSFLLCLGFCGIFTLIMASQVETVKVLGISFSRDNIALLVFPLISAFLFYRSTCLSLFASMIQSAIEQFHETTTEAFAKSELTKLLYFPSTMNIEVAIGRLDESSRTRLPRFYLVWLMINAVFWWVLPIVWILGIVVWLFYDGLFHNGWNVSIAVAISLFVLRTITIIFQGYKYGA
jgi:hypothetical protein